MRALILDTETTGVDEPEPIEVAHIEVSLQDRKLAKIEGQEFVGRFKPSKPIAFGALATHHILDEDLESCPPSSTFALPEGVGYIIGWRIDFDWEVIGKPDVKRIDAMAFARSLWPTLDAHTLGAVLYFLDRQVARERLREAHSAIADCRNCARVLYRMMHELGGFDSFEEMWQACERARVPTIMAVGKHKGMRIADLPRDYKQWFLKQPDVDPYLRQALTGQAVMA